MTKKTIRLHRPHAGVGKRLSPSFHPASVALACAAALAMSAPPAVMAQEQPAVSRASQRLSLPAQPLAQTLSALSRQFGVAIGADSTLVAGQSAPALQGTLTLEEALSRVLGGSGLVAVGSGPSTLSIQRNPAVSPQSSSLPEVRVSARGLREGSAANGYRVKSNSIGGITEQSLLDTPFTVKVLPSELLVNQNMDTIGDLFRVDASVTSSASSAGLYSAPMIRGLSLDNFSNYRVNGMMLINLQATGLENKERVEILKGLSALQAGFASPGGVINYVTKRPTLEPLSDVDLSFNQHGNAKGYVDLSRRTDDRRFGVRLNAGAEAVESFVRSIDGDRRFVSLAADWSVSPDTVLQVDIEHEHRQQGMQPPVQRLAGTQLPDLDPRTFLGQDWASFKTDYTLLGARLEHYLNDRWSMLVEANWVEQKRVQNTIALGGVQANGDVGVFNFFAPAQTYDARTAKFTVKGKFDTGPVRHDLAVGVSDVNYKWAWAPYGASPIGSSNIYNPVTIDEPVKVAEPAFLVLQTQERAFFFNDVVGLGDAWFLHLGGRQARRYQISYLSAGVPEGPPYKKDVFSPSVAVVFKPAANVSTYLSYIEGLEQGGIAEEGRANAGEVLDPLVNRQIEVGVKAELGGVLAEAALFQNKRVAEYYDATDTLVQNGQQRYRGLDLSLTGKLASEWTLFGSLLLLDAKIQETGDPDTDDKTPAGVPKHRVALVAEYAPVALAGWTFSGNWSRTGKRPVTALNTGEAAPGYDLFGLGVRYSTRLGAAPVTVRLNIDNLFDKAYWANANTVLTNGAPRTVSLGARFSF